MQPFRPVRAPDDSLLDIGGARRAADQIDAARQAALAIERAQAIEGLFVAADHIAGANQDEVIAGYRALGVNYRRLRARVTANPMPPEPVASLWRRYDSFSAQD